MTGDKVLGACSVTKKVTVSASEVEALAALHAMIFAKEWEFTGAIFEGDALTIVMQ